jgi:hypothetical protein
VLAVFAVWLVRLSLGIQRAGRFPPPGALIIRETRILTGEQARARARVGFVLAAIVAVAAIALPVYLWNITSLMTLP